MGKKYEPTPELLEEILTKYEVDIKQIKRLDKDTSENTLTLIIIGEYNKRMLNKNELVRNISLIEDVNDVVVE